MARHEKHIAEYVKTCQPCLKAKSKRTIKPEVKPVPIVAPRFHDLVLDIVGPLPTSNSYRYLLTMVDKTSRYVQAMPLTSASSAQCAKAFLDGWVSIFGIPSRASSDNGASFTSKLWTDIHESFGTIVSYSPLYSPQSVGIIERQHKDLKASFRACLIQMGDTYGTQ